MKQTMNKNVALDFVAAINSGNVNRIYDLMTDDHLFIDSQDNRMAGKENMKQAWIGYYQLFPDYNIEVNQVLENSSLICMIGYASGTYKSNKNENNSNYWRIPAVWTAITEEDKIKVWQVYVDNLPVMEIINKNIK
jgi:ketosteroid isomerase-like protein